MRLVHLARFGSPYPGSFIPVLVHLLGSARGQGWSVDAVFGPDAAGRPWLDEFDAADIPWRVAPDVSWRELASRVTELVEEADTPTVLHTHFTRFDVPAALAARRRPDTRVIWHFHTPLSQSFGVRARNRIRLKMFQRRVAAIVCVAPGIRDQVISRGASAGKVRILPNAIDTDRFPLATDGERREARTKLGLPVEATVLLHFGWDWHRKGGDIFLDAVAALRRTMGETTLVGATVGGEADEKRDLPEGVISLAPTADVRALYAAADVLLSPSRAEGQPYAIMEALSCGTPVVASDIPGHTLIADGVSECMIVPGEDSLRVAEAAQELLSRDATTARAEASAAHEAIVTRFGVSAWTDTLLDCYQRLTAEENS